MIRFVDDVFLVLTILKFFSFVYNEEQMQNCNIILYNLVRRSPPLKMTPLVWTLFVEHGRHCPQLAQT